MTIRNYEKASRLYKLLVKISLLQYKLMKNILVSTWSEIEITWIQVVRTNYVMETQDISF